MKKSNEINIILNKFNQKALVEAEKHGRELLTKNALDRYIEFKRDYASIEDRISQAIVPPILASKQVHFLELKEV